MLIAFGLAVACAFGLLGWVVIIGVSPWFALALAGAGLLGMATLANAIVNGRWRPW